MVGVSCCGRVLERVTLQMATVDRFVATSHASYPFEHSRELAGLRHQIILPVEDHLPTTQKTRGGIRAVWVLVASYKLLRSELVSVLVPLCLIVI